MADFHLVFQDTVYVIIYSTSQKKETHKSS